MKFLNVIEKTIKNVTTWTEKHNKIVFTVILTIAIFLNIYKVSTVPRGVNVDEAGMAYDSYCIANYGTDREGNRFPVYFINFGEGQNALYTYLASIFIKIFGLNNLVIRIPAVLLSIAEVIIAYFMMKEFKGKKFGLLFMLIITISPWHIMKSRWSLESYLLSPMLLFSIYELLRAIKTRSKLKYSIAGGLFGIALYSYAVSYVTIPIFLLLTLIYLIKTKKIGIKEIIAFIIPLIVLAMPLILMQLVQKGIVPEIKSAISILKLPNTRGNEIKIGNILSNILSLKYGFGDDQWIFNTIPGFGTVYYFGIVLALIGFLAAIEEVIRSKKNKETTNKININLIMIFYFIATIIWGLLVECNVNRLNGMYIPLTYFIVLAIRDSYKVAKPLFTIIGLAYIISFSLFTPKYFTTLSEQNIPLFDNGIVDLVQYLKKYETKDIYLEDITNGDWIFEMYADPLTPQEYKESIEKDTSKTTIGKYHNGTINIETLDKTSIYVTNEKDKIQALIEKGYSYEIYNNKYCIFYSEEV